MSLPLPPPSLLQGASLFLDFDGTLVHLAETPDAVTVDGPLLDLLHQVERCLEGRITLISGRAAADVRARLEPLRLPVAGSHGLEHEHLAPERPASLDEAAAMLRQLQAEHSGLLLEEKPFGVALHYRLAPEAEDRCREAAEAAAAVTGLALQPGKMVFELKPPEGDKGEAVRRIMATPLHAGCRPVFVGDDLTDEHGFAVARELGGAGILVGAERSTAASYRLADVDAVHHWLEKACGVAA